MLVVGMLGRPGTSGRTGKFGRVLLTPADDPGTA